MDPEIEAPWESAAPPPCAPPAAALPQTVPDFVARRDLYENANPLVPLDCVGVSRPGPDFMAMARLRLSRDFERTPLVGLKKEERAAAVAANARVEAQEARELEQVLSYLYMRALYDPDWEMEVALKGRGVWTRTLPGTFRTYEDECGNPVRVEGYGPRLADVVVVGTCPGQEDVDAGENFSGPPSEALRRAFADLGVTGDEFGSWYWTNVVKHPPVDPAGGLSQKHINNGKPLVEMELRLARPRFVLCLGSVAAKAILGPKVGVDSAFGRVLDLDLPLHCPGSPPRVHRARAMVINHPAKVYHDPDSYAEMVSGLAMFLLLVRGQRESDRESGLVHVNIHTESHLREVVDRLIAQGADGDTIAVDAEWHGDRPDAPGAYLRTIQFSRKAKEAYAVVLRGRNGVLNFRPGPERAIPHLARLLKSTPGRPVRIGGHFLTADMPWLVAAGLDLRPEYRAAPDPESRSGGWDTYRMAHAYQESMEGGFKLENLGARFCGTPRYDLTLREAVDRHCKQHNLKARDLDGYGMLPEDVLHAQDGVAPNYAAYDADLTRRLFDVFDGLPGQPGLLDRDIRGNSCRRACWSSMIAVPAILEMQSVGVKVDRARGNELTVQFMAASDELLAAFRARIGWPEFNPQSHHHCKELLFGVELNALIDKGTGRCRRASPPGVDLLHLTPITAAGKRPKPWERVIADDEVGVRWPSTGKEVLGILASQKGPQAETVRMLRDLRFLLQVLKGTLRRPFKGTDGRLALQHDTETNEELDEDHLIYDGGLMWHVGHDGRVRSRFGLVETGRWSSRAPNLQNISKRREDDYRRILGDHAWKVDKKRGETEPRWHAEGEYLPIFGPPRYACPIRSMIVARPGHVLVEADFKMAELAVIGWLARDPTMCEHVRRNSLSKKHPDFLDVHAATAVGAFRLTNPDGSPLSPTKAALESIGRPGLRTAAKNVNFGVPYGRSAEAIARQCREEGVDVSVEDAQRLIDAYKQVSYPQVAAYLLDCEARVLDPGYICNPFGRYRRFAVADSESTLADQQRAACNYPIQSTVADALNRACLELYLERERHRAAGGDHWFDFCVQIHDALLFEVPIRSLEWFRDEVVVRCMSDRVDIWPTDLDGVRLPGVVEPHHLAIDVEVFRRWGEEIDRDWGLAHGVPARFLPEVDPRPKKPAPRVIRAA